MSHPPAFDIDAFLAKPLVARVATNGPSIRPVWFLWDEGAFWWLTNTGTRLAVRLANDPRVVLVIDTCDLGTGEVKRVVARGDAEVIPLDIERAWRKLSRYLGSDRSRWDPRFAESTFGDPNTRMVRMVPRSLQARDMSFRV